MKNTSNVFAGILLALPLASAQVAAQTTPAEHTFRDAWWAENGQGDLQAALRGYLAAVAADGPDAIRAKALLQAGGVQQRLGKPDLATEIFRQVLRDFPGEAAATAQAQTRLRELTAVDLRPGYDEWYERRLFGEETQLLVLDRIERMASELALAAVQTRNADVHVLRAEIVAYGPGAVPALRRACRAVGPIVDRAVTMLFELGELPPLEALARTSGWASDSRWWNRILVAHIRDDGELVAHASAHSGLLAAAVQGMDALVAAIVAGKGLDAAGDHEVTIAAARAAMRAADGRRALLDATTTPATPVRVREAIERACTDENGGAAVPLTPAEWLRLGTDPVRFETRVHAVWRASLHLGADDLGLLDEIMTRVTQALPSAREELTCRLVYGLDANSAATRMPWTAERLHRVLCIAAPYESAEPAPLLQALRRQDATRAVLATTLFHAPSELYRALSGNDDDSEPDRVATGRLGQMLSLNLDDERDVELVASRWHAALATACASAWPHLDDPARGDALTILAGASHETGDRAPLIALLTGLHAEASATMQTQLNATIEQLR